MSKSGSSYAKRRGSRLAAVQALYQMELSGATAVNAIADQALREPDPETEGKVRAPIDPAFFGELVRGVRDRRDDIDRMIDGALMEGWAIARLDAVLRATLRTGVCEMLTREDIDAPVIINEYVEIAKSFFDGSEPKITNGVLDKLAKVLRTGGGQEDDGGTQKDNGDAGQTG